MLVIIKLVVKPLRFGNIDITEHVNNVSYTRNTLITEENKKLTFKIDHLSF